MKYVVKNTAIKINHKLYNIGDEIQLNSVPDSLKKLLILVQPEIVSNAKTPVKPETPIVKMISDKKDETNSDVKPDSAKIVNKEIKLRKKNKIVKKIKK